MKINADFNQRVVLETNQLEWQDSPIQGVQRRMLDREGAEIARATSLVKYAPGSYFSAHTHGGGEEFFVLEGTFSDNHGDYPAGTYVRNPVGSTHQPFSQEGCIIFVKLWQISPEDTAQKTINTNNSGWIPGLVKGLSVMPLHTHGTENIALVKWESGTKFQTHRHWGGEEILVLQGTFADDQGIYPQGTWLRNPPDSIHTPYSDEGCIIYVKTGHLA